MTDDQQTAKPWGSDEDFDAAKAWSLIEGLRADKAKLTTDLTAERQARTAAEQAVKDADPEGKLKAAEDRATKAERQLAVANVLVDFPTLKGFEDFLTGATPEELKASAEKLASLGKPAEEGKKGDEEGTPKAPASSTPEPQLTPGHGGEQTPTFDPAAIAAAARA